MFSKPALHFTLATLTVKTVKVIYKLYSFWFDYILKNKKKNIYLPEVMIVTMKIYNADDCCVILSQDPV